MNNFERVLAEVGRRYGLTRDQLLSPTRGSQNVAWARQIAIHLCHRLDPSLSWSAIGRLFGRDRTTVRYANEMVSEYRDGEFDETLMEMERVCSTSPI